MPKETRKSFYEPSKKTFLIEEDIVEEPESMPVCHYHNNYEFYYLRSGRRYYFIKDKTYLISRGTIVFINKFDIHSTESYENESYERILISFSDEYIEGLLSALGEEDLFSNFKDTEVIIELSDEKISLCEGILSSMLKEYEKSSGQNTPYLKSALLSLLMLMRAEKDIAVKPKENSDIPHRAISEIIGYINNNYANDITLESISEKFYISPFYFSRTFKKVSGLGFTEYLSNVRIKESRRLIRETDMSITDISTAVGYKSITHFGRVFQKIVGLSPTEYRKRK